MASITWTCVFIFLIFELVTTFVLVFPVPRQIRNKIARLIFRFHLGENFSKAIAFIAFALVLALVESYNTTRKLLEKLTQMEEQDLTGGPPGPHHHHHGHHHDKQRLYKAERNMYLAGFALTLLFVIGRILQLMQESVELEDELEFVRRKKPASSSSNADTVVAEDGVEMTEVKKKNAEDKKKD